MVDGIEPTSFWKATGNFDIGAFGLSARRVSATPPTMPTLVDAVPSAAAFALAIIRKNRR
jgi:hypothetical protein